MEKVRIAVRKFGPFETAMQQLWDAFCLKNNISIAVEMVPMELHDWDADFAMWCSYKYLNIKYL